MEAEIATLPIHGPGGKENRSFLHDLCTEIYTFQDKAEGITKNMRLIQYYESFGFSDFRTYKQWKEAGKQVKKGEKAFLVWAKPLSSQKPKEEATAEDQDGPEFFPLCYLFAASQVQ